MLYTMKSKKIFLLSAIFAVLVGFFGQIEANAQTSLPAPRQEKLLNGLKILMWSDAKANNVTVRIRVHAGSAFDPRDREGLMQLLSDNLFPNDAAREFFADDLGGGLEVETTYDYIQVNASAKPESLVRMLETLATAVSDPAIDKETTLKLKNALLAKIASSEADASYVADRAVASRLFGTFPYGRPLLGTPDSVKKIDFADLLGAKERFLTADNATMTIAGNYDRSLALKAVRRYFGGWLKADKKVPSTFRQPDPPPPGVLTLASPEADVSAIRFAVRGVARNDPDFSAAEIYAAILETRLQFAVPGEHSADVFLRNESHTLPGMVVIGFVASRFKSSEGKLNAVDLVSKALAMPLTQIEFEAAKTQLGVERKNRELALFWLDADTYGIGNVQGDINAANTVTLRDVAAFAERFRTQPMVSVLVNTPPKAN